LGIALAYPTVFPVGLTIWEPEALPGIVIFRPRMASSAPSLRTEK